MLGTMLNNVLISVGISLLLMFDACKGDFQPFSIAPPSFPSVKITQQPSSFWATQTRPIHTNRYWENLALGDGTASIYPNPYRVSAQPKGLGFAWPTRVATTSDVNVFGDNNVILGGSEPLQAHSVIAEDLLSVTVRWRSSQTNNNYITAPIVRGMPYITQTYQSITPYCWLQTGVISIQGQQGAIGTTYTATKFTVVAGDGKKWLLYSSSKISLKWQDLFTLVATTPFTGYIRAIVLTDPSLENLLDQYSASYPVAGNVNITVSGDVATITHSWQTQGTGGSGQPVLLFALPHHLDTMVNPKKTNFVVWSIKGKAVALAGNSWTMIEQLTTVTWLNSIPPKQQYVQKILDNLKVDANGIVNAADCYSSGTELGRLARIALIADELGQDQTATQVRTTIKHYLGAWLSGTNVDPLGYETQWGGLITRNNFNCSACDYGNSWFNDHHFHYGYYLYAAAVVAKADSDWVRSNLKPLLDMARDFANPSPSDPYYPVFRHKDFYDGHSWASGLFVFNGGGNQESSSEAINAYYGLYLLGQVLGDSNMKDVGRVLLALEMRAVQKYYHMSSESDIYEQIFAQNKCVGRLWTTGALYSTWFGANVEYIHIIQMLPFTSISEVLLNKDWIEEEYPVLATALTRTTDPIQMEWRVYAYMAHAIIDADAAAQEISALTSSDLDSDLGNSGTNVWHWVATRP